MTKTQPDIIVDVTGETCPIPLVEMRKAVMKAEKGQVIELKGTHDASRKEMPMAIDSLGLSLLQNTEDDDGIWHILIQK
jgi:tRNA 2-thiouridine synthesizing protein A